MLPSLLHDRRVVVATATLALQHQLVERDIPRLVEGFDPLPALIELARKYAAGEDALLKKIERSL